MLKELGYQGERATLLADGAYLDNVGLAEGNNIEFIATALTGPAPSDIHSGYEIKEETHEIICCPMGHKPESFRHNEKRNDYRITFAREDCENCPNKEKCRAVVQQKNAVVKLSQNMIDRAKYIEHISAGEYIRLQKKRNGVEGIPSILRRRYNIDRIPVYGYFASKFWYGMKIGAINVFRMIKALQIRALFLKKYVFLTKKFILMCQKENL